MDEAFQAWWNGYAHDDDGDHELARRAWAAATERAAGVADAERADLEVKAGGCRTDTVYLSAMFAADQLGRVATAIRGE